MSNIDKQALRERYSPKPVPECHICGKEMTIQRMSASRITYGCTGATYDDKGCHYAEGRSIADDHYEQSRVTVVDVSDPDVLALLDELDSANGYASAYEAEKWHYHGLAESEGERADRAEKRVSELECIATDYGVKFQKAQDALKHQALLHKSQMEAAEKRLAGLSKAASVNSQWKPDVCPVTGRKFFMWIEHETLGYVPTYGGPFDSYTIPTRDSSGEFSCERYDHDLGGWVGGEFIGLYLIDDDEQCRVCELEERIAELERSETQLINERDAAESALADMYQAATGERPEWSNMFGFADAVDVVEERLATLEANQSQTTPTGIQLITEAIGAHGYIVGCLLQGRPDLALEESRKWVSAFGQAAEIVSAQDADDIKVKGE